MDNHVQVLKSVPVNLSLSTEPQEAKREPFTSSPGPGGLAGDGASPALTVVKAEMYAPVFMTGTGLHYRMEKEEEQASRVIYEQNPYEVTTLSHTSYVKEARQSPPDSPYQEEQDGVRNHRWTRASPASSLFQLWALLTPDCLSGSSRCETRLF